MSWSFGEIFLRKFICNFNLDSKTISFYINRGNDSNFDKNKNNSMTEYKRIFVEIIFGFFILLFLYLFYRKYKKSRKLHANELEDSNYSYISKNNNDAPKII